MIYVDRADGIFRSFGIKADSFNKYDFIGIVIQQIGVDQNRQINLTKVRLDPFLNPPNQRSILLN